MAGQRVQLLWYMFEVLLHSLHHYHMAVINLVCFTGVFDVIN